MSSQKSSAAIELRVTGLGVCYKPFETGPSSMAADYSQLRPNSPELDPDRVELSFAGLDEGEHRNNAGQLQMTKSELDKLNLRVGDIVSIKIAKAQEK